MTLTLKRALEIVGEMMKFIALYADYARDGKISEQESINLIKHVIHISQILLEKELNEEAVALVLQGTAMILRGLGIRTEITLPRKDVVNE